MSDNGTSLHYVKRLQSLQPTAAARRQEVEQGRAVERSAIASMPSTSQLVQKNVMQAVLAIRDHLRRELAELREEVRQQIEDAQAQVLVTVTRFLDTQLQSRVEEELGKRKPVSSTVLEERLRQTFEGVDAHLKHCLGEMETYGDEVNAAIKQLDENQTAHDQELFEVGTYVKGLYDAVKALPTPVVEVPKDAITVKVEQPSIVTQEPAPRKPRKVVKSILYDSGTGRPSQVVEEEVEED